MDVRDLRPQSYAAGMAARTAGVDRADCPHASGRGGYRRAWLLGWDEPDGERVAPGTTLPRAPTRSPTAAETVRSLLEADPRWWTHAEAAAAVTSHQRSAVLTALQRGVTAGYLETREPAKGIHRGRPQAWRWRTAAPAAAPDVRPLAKAPADPAAPPVPVTAHDRVTALEARVAALESLIRHGLVRVLPVGSRPLAEGQDRPSPAIVDELQDSPSALVHHVAPAPTTARERTRAAGYAAGLAGDHASSNPIGYEDGRLRQAWLDGWRRGAENRARAERGAPLKASLVRAEADK